jgi:hypothetical protein
MFRESGAFEPRREKRSESPFARPALRRRVFLCPSRQAKGVSVANHLTPEELSKELGIDRMEVIRLCVEESIPIYQGKIDKTLFQAQLAALSADRTAA